MTIRPRGPCWPRLRALVVASLLVAVAPSASRGAGALLVNGAGAPLVWSTSPVPWNPDQGSLGTLSNALAVSFVDTSFGAWHAVPTAAITFANAGALPVDVTAANVASFFGVCDDARSPIIFDSDGSIVDLLLGTGASQTVLGFSEPECGTFVPPVITEAVAVLNGKFIDGITSPDNPELSLADFAGVLVHEFGHFVNLDHSQINLTEAFNGTSADDAAVATMFPFLVNGTEATSLARDDRVSLATLYPAASFTTSTGRIAGSLFRSDGATLFQGGYVIARNLADPRIDAVGVTSGGRFFPAEQGGPPDPALRGAYDLPGLTAGADYTVEVERISPSFTGGSSVGPFSVPVALPGPAEFWSAADEAGTHPPDDPAAAGAPITVAAGTTTTGIDVILNAPVVPANDGCGNAVAIETFPFNATLDTSAATRAPDDPTQPCTGSGTPQNSNSVWYRFTAPGAGTVTLTTAGSTYDTVVTAHTGVCGALGLVGCNDNASDLDAVLSLPVASGTTYYVDVTDFGAPGGGTLVLAATFSPTPPPGCTSAAPGACIPGTGPVRADCLTEWWVEPLPLVLRATPPKKNVPTHRVTCADGEARCDFDGVAAKNGRCTFHVAVCVNNHDPRPATAGCTPGAIVSSLLRKPSVRRPKDAIDVQNATTLQGAIAALASPPASISGALTSFAPSLMAADRCTPFVSLIVPVGTRAFRMTATTSEKRKDTDQLRLTCLP